MSGQLIKRFGAWEGKQLRSPQLLELSHLSPSFHTLGRDASTTNLQLACTAAPLFEEPSQRFRSLPLRRTRLRKPPGPLPSEPR